MIFVNQTESSRLESAKKQCGSTSLDIREYRQQEAEQPSLQKELYRGINIIKYFKFKSKGKSFWLFN